MEIRARYFLIGLFVLVIAAGIVGFTYWLYATGGLVQRTTYQVRFDGTVSGLSEGSQVQFNGIEVGEVTTLSLDPDNPGAVLATIAIDKATPVRADTHVGLAFSGLTGTAAVSLVGGASDAALLASSDGHPPLLVADAADLKDLTQSARDALNQLNDIFAENAAPLKDTIANVDTFSKALARNSDAVDSIIAGLQRLTGGGPPAPENTMYDLTAPTKFPPLAHLPMGQLVVTRPTAPIMLDTQRILQVHAGGEVPVFETVRWADSLPILIQERAVQAFENAGYRRVVKDDISASGDFQLLVDLRRFRIGDSSPTTAEVAFAAKVVDRDGKVVDGKDFAASAPLANSDDAMAAATALNMAFGNAMGDMVNWVLTTIDTAETAGSSGSSTVPDLGFPTAPAQ